MRLAVDDLINQALRGQHINLDAEPDFIQQKKIVTLIYFAAAARDLGLLTPAMLSDTMTPSTIVLVRPNQPRARINIETLRYCGGSCSARDTAIFSASSNALSATMGSRAGATSRFYRTIWQAD